ncbi:MAG TPA: hypothetical protein VIJ18_02270 [Microbacteriaceae bacterium]
MAFSVIVTHAPAGWYPNPHNPKEELYWGGETWVGPSRTRSAARSTATRPQRPREVVYAHTAQEHTIQYTMEPTMEQTMEHTIEHTMEHTTEPLQPAASPQPYPPGVPEPTGSVKLTV